MPAGASLPQNRPCDLARGDFYFSPFAASDSRHNPSPGTAVRRGAPGRVCGRALARRGAPGRVCLRVLTRPGKGRYCLSPFTASDSRHNLRPGTTFSREAAGRVWEGAPAGASPLIEGLGSSALWLRIRGSRRWGLSQNLPPLWPPGSRFPAQLPSLPAPAWTDRCCCPPWR